MTDAVITDSTFPTPETPNESGEENAPVREARLWQGDGWTARVIKNESDEGWAVEMIKDGEAEPALVAPWTMGRDKKNPKPLDTNAFNTWVKTASEVLRRHEQQLQAMLHKEVYATVGETRWKVTLDIVADEYDPYAMLSAFDEFDEQVAQVKVTPAFKLNMGSATTWIENEFAKPR